MSAAESAPLALITDDASLAVARIHGEGAEWSAELETRLDMAARGMVFMWPTWSPSGDEIVVSASSQRREDPRLELWRLRLDDEPTSPGTVQEPHQESQGSPTSIFQNPRDGRQVIAAGLAHYVSWSPANRALAVVANVGSGLAVNLVAAHGRGSTRRLVDGAPLYFAWAPDGRAIVVHRAAQLVLFDLSAGSEGPIQIQRSRPSFRSPAWSQDGSRFYFARPRPGGGSTIMRARRREVGGSGEHEALMELDGAASFVASRCDDRLAVLRLAANDSEGRELSILDPNSGVRQAVADRAMSGVTWSPDGRALFAWEPQPSSTMIALTRYDLGEPGEVAGMRPGVRLARFQPSAEFATMLTFHDQFAHSHQVVSPCGRWLTFAGLALGNGGSGRRGFGPQNGCYIVPADGSAPPRRIAAGSISFFPSSLPSSPSSSSPSDQEAG